MSTSPEPSLTGINGPYRYRPAPALWLSLGFHVAAAAAIVLEPSLWLWVLGMILANHIVLGLIGLWPRSQWLGENIVRLPARAGRAAQVALTIDDGPDAVVTPQVLDCLDQFRAKASFFCIGTRAAMHPEIVAEIVRRGHSIENHSQHHPYGFACFGPHHLKREIEAAQILLTRLAGEAPRFFRAPAGIRNPFLDWVMAKTGLHYISWTRRGFDAVRGDPAGVLKRLVRGLAAGDVLLLHDGSAALTPAGHPVVLAVLPELLSTLQSRGLVAVSLRTAFTITAEERSKGPESARDGARGAASRRLPH
jgi:peptidoglycan/xylan/chitin deacetylase (PgdA/CDA1 family)